MDAQTTLPEFLARAGTQIVAAFFGAIFAFAFARWKQRSDRRQDSTLRFIDEYFSSTFLAHRAAVHQLREKHEARLLSIESIAAGFWYPGLPGRCHAGEKLGDLNEHQHLRAYLGFLIRLSHAHRRGLLDVPLARSALSSAYDWEAGFIRQVAEETRRQAVDGKARPPTWLDCVEEIRQILHAPAQREAHGEARATAS